MNIGIGNAPALVLDKIPHPSTIHIGMTVIGTWKDSKYWHFGRVYQLKKEDDKTLFHIVFHDNDQIWHGVENIRIVPMKRHDGKQTQHIVIKNKIK